MVERRDGPSWLRDDDDHDGFKTTEPYVYGRTTKNKKNKVSSDMGSVSDPTIHTLFSWSMFSMDV